MRSLVLPIHPGLSDNSRLPALSRPEQSIRVAEVLLLLSAGTTAAVMSAFLDLHLRMPGHAIIRAVFPMALGLALAPRRMAGMVMGSGALGASLGINAWGSGGLGVGATTSLVLTGPLLDFALWRAQRGWAVYFGFALAGLGANAIAFTTRAVAKLGGIGGRGGGGGRGFAEWWPQAILTYAVFGVLAGLISAVVWFRFASRQQDDTDKAADS